MIINYNSLSRGRDAWLRKSIENVGSPPILNSVTKRSWLVSLLLIMAFMLPVSVFAQAPANYTFAASSGTYVPITVASGATAVPTAYADSASYNIVGTTAFTVNGVTYVNYQINSNGSVIAYGATAPSAQTTLYTPLSSTVTNVGAAFGVFAADLAISTLATSTWMYQTIGDEIIFQWDNVSRYNSTGNNDILNFQIRLNTSTGTIKYVYGTCTLGTNPTLSPQVGFRSNTTTFATDVNNLGLNITGSPTTCSWDNVVTGSTNAANLYINNANPSLKPSSGLTYTWTKQTSPSPVRTFGATTAVTSAGATIAWTAPTGATQYNIQYKTVGSCTWTNFAGNPVSSATATLTGLTAGSTYLVRVQSSNGSSASIYSHTPNLAGTGDGYNATGTFTTIATCTLPSALVSSASSATTANLSWTASASNPVNGYEWEVRTSGAAGSGATGLAASGTTAAGVVTASASGLTPNTSNTLYVRAHCVGSDYSNWVSGTAFSTPVSCVVPTALVATATSTTSANVSWTASTSTPPNGYEWELRTSGAGGSGATGLAANGSTAAGVVTATASTLIANTTYTLYVRAHCVGSDFSTWAAGTAFTTPCSVATLPLATETFTTTSLPACWTTTAISGTTVWAPAVSNDGVPSPRTGTYFMGKTWNNSDAIVVSQPFDMTTASNGARVSVWIYRFATSAASDRIRFHVNTAPNLTGATQILEIFPRLTVAPTVSSAGWYNYVVNIPATFNTATSLYVIAQGTTSATSSSYGIGFDDFTIEKIPACGDVTAVTLGALSSNSATLTWTAPTTAPANGYQYEVRTSGAAGSGTTGLVDSGSTAAGVVNFTTNLLAASTSYTVYVRSNCGSGLFGNWAASSAFTTPCVALPVPYTMDFEAAVIPALPTCTSVQQLGTGNQWLTASPAAYGFTSKALRYTYSSSNAANTWFFTQGVALTAGTSYTIAYRYGASGFPENLKVAYGTAPVASSMTLPLATHAAISTSTAQSNSVVFTAPTTGAYYFGFQAYSTANQFYLIVDDIVVDKTPTCFVPTALTVTSATLTGGTFSWTAPTSAPALGYEYEVRTSGTAGSGATGLTTSGTTAAGVLTATVSGLAASTTYSVYVRSHCATTDYSSWTAAASIYTGYCVATGASSTYYINNFATTGGATNIVNNATGYSATGYLDATAKSASHYAGGTLNFTASYDTGGTNTYGFSVFVDWNNDLDFADAGEKVYGTTAYASTASGSFNIPIGQALGNYRMRIVANYSSPTPVACSSAINGETEDYTFTVIATPACTAPTALTVTAVQGFTATVSWTASTITTATNGYEYEVRTSGAAGSGSTGLATSGTTASGVVTKALTGLNAGTAYTVYVRAHCATPDFSDWTSKTFTTQSVVAAPWTEGFTGTTLPSGWTAPDYQVGNFTNVSGNPGSAIVANMYDDFDTSLYTAPLTTLNVGPVTANQIFQFDYAASNYSSPYAPPASGSGNFVVSISTDYGSTYTVLATVTNDAVAGYRTKSFPLTAYAGQVIKIKIVANYVSGDYFAAFDNFKVSPICTGTPAVATLSPAVQNMCTGTPVLTINAAGYSTDAGISMQWEQSTNAGSTWANAVGGSGATGAAYTPPNFAGTTIQYRLKTTCTGSGLVSYSNVSEINSNPKALPLHEDFSDINTLGGWTRVGNVLIGTARGATGNPGANAFVNMTSSVTSANFTSAKYGNIVAGQAFSFDLKLSNSASPYATPAAGWGSIAVQVSADCGGSFTTIGTINTFTGSAYKNYKFNLSAYVGSGILTRLLITRLAGDYDVSVDNWSIDTPEPQIESFTPTSVCSAASTPVILTGYAFTGATAVKFNGTNAVSFTVNSDTSISAVAPAGVTDGFITITSPKGTGTSLNAYGVLQSPVVSPITNGNAVLCVEETVDMDNASSGGNWSSSAPLIATVDNDGIVTAVSAGNAVISYTVADGGCSTTVTSTVHVNAPVASSDPVAQTVVTGHVATYSVTATGAVQSYQWQSSPDDGEYSDIANDATFGGATTNTLTLTNTPDSLNGYYFRVVITAATPCPEYTTAGAILNVGDTGITTNPSNALLCSSGNGIAVFTVVPSGTVSSYKWYQNAGSGFIAINDGPSGSLSFSGTTTDQLTVSGIVYANTGISYRVVITGPANTATSNPATLTVSQGITSVVNPVQQTNCTSGGTAVFTASASGDVAGYQWQFSADGTNFTSVTNGTPSGATYAGSTTGTLNVTTTAATPATGTYYYRALISGNAPCAAVPTDGALLHIYAPAITAQPAPVAAYTGTTPTFAVTTSATGATYQWQYATALAGPYADVVDSTPAGITYTGATSSTLSVVLSSSALASSARYYRAVVTQGGCSSASTGAQLSISAYCMPTTTNAAMGVANAVTNVVISNVTAGTNLTQASSAVSPWYTLYTANTLNVVQGQDMSVAITFGTNGTQYSAVWIDYNQNGAFEANENVGLAATSNGASSTKTYTFTVPFTALAGVTRLRVRGGARAVYTAAGACTSSAYGETEDYVLNIATAPACSGNPVAGTAVSSVASLCQSGTATLTASGFPTMITGISMQWYNAATGPISGATLATYTTPTIATTSSYFLRVSCANGGGFTDTNTVTITVNNPTVVSTVPGTRCGLGTVALSATGSAGTEVSWYSASTGGTLLATGNTFTTPSINATTTYYAGAQLIGPGTVSVGTGASTGSSAPYTFADGTYGGMKGQYLFTATELKAAGIKAGNINSLGFDVTTVGSALQGFTVEMGTTSMTEFATPLSIIGGLTTVVNSATVTPVSGINTLVFNTPFAWDGTSNIIVSTSWSNNNTSNTATSMRYDATTNYSSQSYRQDSATSASMLAFTGATGVGTSTFDRSQNRLKFIFGGTNVISCVSSSRTAVAATVTAPPALVLSTTNASFCVGSGGVLVTLTSPAANFDSYTWLPTSGVSGSAASGFTFNPTATTTYTLTATNASGCTNTAALVVTVNPLPVALAITPASPTICTGSIQALSAGTAGGSGVFGTGTNVPSTTTWPNPFNAWYGGVKHQMLYTAAELTAKGLQAGSTINALQWYIDTFSAKACVDFTIRIGTTSNTALTSFVSGTATVYGPTTYTPSANGFNNFTLTTPYVWDGVSNLVIETVHNAGNGGNGTGTLIRTTTTPTNTVYYRAKDNVTGGIAAFDALTDGSVGATNNRPNATFVFVNPGVKWTPVTGLYTDTQATVAYTAGAIANTVYAKPLTTTTYTATFTSAANCTSSSTNTVTVNQNYPFYVDADRDGYGTGSLVQVCSANGTTVPTGYSLNNTDCNDNNVAVFQSATLYADADGDGYSVSSAVTCYGATVPAGYSLTTLGNDCDDTDNTKHASFPFYVDADHDNYGTGSLVQVCAVNATTPPVGYSVNNTDCNDNNVAVFQSATLYADADGDGYSVSSAVTCYGATVPAGYSLTTLGNDCDDADNTKHASFPFYVDTDHDNYGTGSLVQVCAVNATTPPVGYSVNNTDCNDNIAAINPGHAEVLYNGIDDNCDGNLDEGFQIKTKLLPSFCGATLTSLGSLIGITTLATSNQVTGYRIRVTNGTTVQVIDRSLPNFTMTMFPSYEYATTYTVEIQVQRNGVYLGYYGDPCFVSTPAVLDEGGATSVSPAQCGQRIATLTTLVATTPLANATGYRFRITDITPGGTGLVQTIDRSLYWFAFTMLDHYNYNATYTVEVAVKTTGAYSGFGSPCEVSTPLVPVTSCGVTAASATTPITALSANGATQYRFIVTKMPENSPTTIDRSTNFFTFSMIPGYVPGGRYSVRVATLTKDVFSTYSDACTVFAPGGTVTKTEVGVEGSLSFNAVAHPNPFASDFAISVTTPSDEQVHLKVYDMLGKLIESREVEVSNLEGQKVGARYAAGVYNVIVTQGTNVKTLRVIKR